MDLLEVIVVATYSVARGFDNNIRFRWYAVTTPSV